MEDRIDIELLKLGLRGITFISSAGNNGNHLSKLATNKNYTDEKNRMIKDINKLTCSMSIDAFPASSA